MRRLLVSLIAISLSGCESSSPPPTDRESKLLTLAAGEAQQITSARERLTRQLNFASRQMQRGQPAEAKQSLEYAAKTLRDAKPGELNSQKRIAGWVSISELSRAGKDITTAQTACDQAVATLRQITPVAERPNYVIGVASEVQALHGKDTAAKLLEESALWIKQIQRVTSRRSALTHIADAIFDDGDMPGGLQLLRTDPDATWRSDTLAMLAETGGRTPRDANGNVMANYRSGSRSLDWVSNHGFSGGYSSIPGSDAASPTVARNNLLTTNPSESEWSNQPVDFLSNFQHDDTTAEQPTR